MRFYDLVIGNNDFHLRADKNNRSPLNIEFELKAFQGGGALVPGFIKIDNPPLSWFTTDRNKIVGKRIILRAGFEDGVFTRALGYKRVYDDLLLVATISNVLGDYSSLTPSMLIYFAINEQDAKDMKLIKQRGLELQNQLNEMQVIVKPRQALANVLAKGVSYFTGWLTNPFLLGKVSKSAQTIIITASTLAQLFAQYKRHFNVDAYIDPSRCMITLFDEQECERTNNWPKAGFASVDFRDLVSQPEVLDLSLKISCVFRMRGDLRLGTIIRFKGKMPSTRSISQQQLMTNQSFVGSAVRLENVFKLGTYRIISLEHKGSYYNNSVEGWTTSVIAAPVGGVLNVMKGLL